MNMLCCVVNFNGERYILELHSLTTFQDKKFMIHGCEEDGSTFKEVVNYDDVEFIGIDDPDSKK